jgi:hypothetical protein
MENRTLFVAYLLTWAGYLIAMYAFCRVRHLHLGIASISHLVPSVIAIMMIRIFLVGHGSTIAQFAAGSESATHLWKQWFHLWPALFFAAGTSVLVHLVWTAVAGFAARYRKWVPVSSSGLLMSLFAFLAVGTNFPDA